MSETLDFDLVAQQAAQAARELLEAANLSLIHISEPTRH